MQQAVEIELEQKLDDRAFVLALGTRVLHDGNVQCETSDSGIAMVENLDESDESDVTDETDVTDLTDLTDVTDVTDVTGGAIEAKTDAAKESSRAANAEHPPRKATLRSALAQYMIHITTCRDCGGAWQDGGGVRAQINKSVLERAQCNAIICDDENGKRPVRTIPAPVQRLVLERAQHRCEVPGCRSSKHLTIHHIVFWSHGGTHDPSNLIVLCDGHHRVLHDGLLRITGRAPDALVFERNGVALVGKVEGHALPKHANGRAVKRAMSAPNLDEDSPVVLAQAALRQMGFKAAQAVGAVETACAHVGADAELSVLIKEALQHCR
jgi:hypothetical protein